MDRIHERNVIQHKYWLDIDGWKKKSGVKIEMNGRKSHIQTTQTSTRIVDKENDSLTFTQTPNGFSIMDGCIRSMCVCVCAYIIRIFYSFKLLYEIVERENVIILDKER